VGCPRGYHGAYPVQRVTDEGTWLRLQKETGNSYLIVFSPGEPESAKGMTAETHPAHGFHWMASGR